MTAWTLTHGDCLDPVTGLASLADRSVDHVIMDPPYEAEAHTKERRSRGKTLGGGRRELQSVPIDFDPITDEQRFAVAAQAARVCRRWIIVFCQLEGAHLWKDALEAGGAEYVRTGVWTKPDGQPQLTGDRPGVGYETLVIGHAARESGKMSWNGGGRRAVWNFNKHDGMGPNVHTTQKPLNLMTALIRDFTDHGEIILDPFAGSGTTGVAALQNGRRFIGWERDERYHAVASRRLGEAREQPGLALGPKVRSAKTADMFGGTKP